MKPFLAILAIVITLLGYIPYFKGTIDKKTEPHVFSWFTWGLASIIAFGIQLAGNGGAGAYVNLVMGVGCFTLVLFSLKNGIGYITKMDTISLSFAVLAIILWVFVKQPVLSLVLIILIDVFSFLPSIRKAWKEPFRESVTPFASSCVKNGLTILAMSTISLNTIAYPVFSFLSTLAFIIMVLVRRSTIKVLHE